MDVVDILVSIVVVTILVTIILAVVTYVAYKLRLSREPARNEQANDEPRYFVRYDPPGAESATAAESEAEASLRDTSGTG
jgi:flagellar basal body-associated protein FliL